MKNCNLPNGELWSGSPKKAGRQRGSSANGIGSCVLNSQSRFVRFCLLLLLVNNRCGWQEGWAAGLLLLQCAEQLLSHLSLWLPCFCRVASIYISRN
ncbi:hypothetical protein SLEP1_g49287 [Rubroshorea leprosula]|uniref:Uncharacterized protein n=1 Tax=Rubroshorea leprosula TaxID=152421 RepID=A0AAV5LWB3_9ROSI|nr:hypothetical protein SLEP1_g49287 [Rubroshorea leprosula]